MVVVADHPQRSGDPVRQDHGVHRHHHHPRADWILHQQLQAEVRQDHAEGLSCYIFVFV